MKKIEWLLAVLLIIIGLACLTVSGATMWRDESIKSYVATFMQICFWTGLPVIIIGFLYAIYLISNKNK